MSKNQFEILCSIIPLGQENSIGDMIYYHFLNYNSRSVAMELMDKYIEDVYERWANRV